MHLRSLASIVSAFVLFLGLFSMNAYADSCDGLDKNAKWLKLSKTLDINIEAGEYKSALETIESMKEICSRAPILNYNAGVVYRRMGDDTKALYYLQIATLNTEEFAVKGSELERIWYERYEAEHPQATQGSIESYQTQILELTEENAKLKDELKLVTENKLKTEYMYMWTGVGIAGTGILLAATGGVIVGVMNDPIQVSSGNHVSYNTIRDMGWGFMGAGIGLTIAGSILAGISGYRYSQIKKLSNDQAVSVSLNSTGLELRF